MSRKLQAQDTGKLKKPRVYSQPKQVDTFGIVMLMAFFTGLAIIVYLKHDYDTGPTGGWHKLGRQVVKELMFYGALFHVTVLCGETFIFRWRRRNASPSAIFSPVVQRGSMVLAQWQCWLLVFRGLPHDICYLVHAYGAPDIDMFLNT